MSAARDEVRLRVAHGVADRLNGHRWDKGDTRALVDHLREDDEFVSRLVFAYVPQMVEQAVELAMALHSPDPTMTATLTDLEPGTAVIKTNNGTLLRREAIDRAAAELQGRWEGWVERVGSRGIPFLDMTKADLLQASRHRKERGQQEISLALLEIRIAKTLRGTERVRDRYTAEDLDALRDELEQKQLGGGG